MRFRATVKPELFRWACERSGYDPHDLAVRFPRLPAWESGEKQSTLKQQEVEQLRTLANRLVYGLR